MGKVVEIGIVDIKGGKIINVDKVTAVKGKGLLNDRKFRENNEKQCQITLIEIENINHFNKHQLFSNQFITLLICKSGGKIG